MLHVNLKKINLGDVVYWTAQPWEEMEQKMLSNHGESYIKKKTNLKIK
jgi:hypothetical protein